MNNKLIIDLDDNEQVKKFLADKGAGERVKFEVEATIDDVSGDKAILSLKEVNAINEEPGEEVKEGEDTGKSKPLAPVMMAMGAGGEKDEEY